MKFLLGSHFWKMNVQSSDKDYTEYIFPTKLDLFNNTMVSRFSTSETTDTNFKDIRCLLLELKKGSINAFSCLYSSETIFNSELRFLELWYFLDRNKDTLLEELNYEFKKSCYGELCNRLKQLEKDPTNSKQLAHIFKLDYLLSCESNPFKSWFKEKQYKTAVQYRNTTDEQELMKLFNQFKTKRDYWSTVTFEKTESKPTLEKLQNLLVSLCFEL